MPDLWGFIDTPEIQWRLATSGPVTRLHRGVGLRKGDMPPELEQRFVSALEGGIGDPDLASDLLAHMDRDGTGLGGFWAHSKDGPWLAEGFSRRVQPSRWQNDPADYSVVMGADWDGSGSHYDWDTDPDYRKLLPGAKIRVNSVRISSPKHDWLELGGDQERHAHRTAMAWDEWRDKIKHSQPSDDWRPLQRYPEGAYTVEHFNSEGDVHDISDLTYSLRGDNKLHVDMLYVSPQYQRQGLAEAFMRRMNEDYPNHVIDPGSMTHQGRGFYDRMLQKEPDARDLVTAASRIIEAMAWQDWAPHIEKECRDCEWDFEGRKTHRHLEPDWNYSGGNPMRYVIEHPTKYPGRSTLDYGHYLDDDNKPFLGIHMIETDPEFQHDGVAESLMRKLHEDYPGVPIDPGGMTDEGKGFKEKLENKIPEAKSVLRQRPSYTARIAMAWQDWKDKIRGGCEDGCGLHSEGRYTIPQAGAFMDYVHRAPEGKPTAHILSIYTHPSDRGSGVAEALVRRLAEDHPGVLINPGTMTNDGQKFHDRMLEKDPSARDLVTAANQIIAMAWDEWAETATHNPPDGNGPYGNQGSYVVNHGPGQESGLLYSLFAEGPEDNSIFIDSLYTHPKFRQQGVAEAFFRRLNQDYPDRKINPGAMTGEGQQFHDRMLEKEPTARDLVTAASRIVEAMAWEDPGFIEISDTPPKGYPRIDLTQWNRPVRQDSLNDLYNTQMQAQMSPMVDYLNRQEDAAEDLDFGHTDRHWPSEYGREVTKLAMAWEDWKDKIRGGCRACYDGWEGRYTIPQAGAFLNYTHGTHNGNPSVKVDGIYTHPSDRGKGVMEALIRRLVEDHPGTHISPGMMTTDGQKFHDRMLEKDPGAKDIVTAANWVLQSIARNTR